MATVTCSIIIGEDVAGTDEEGSEAMETATAEVVTGGGGGGMVVVGGPDIADTRLIGLVILPGLLRRL
jgi:hypothetical protein